MSAKWICPECGKSNSLTKFVCVGRGVGRKELARHVNMILCGYDRRVGKISQHCERLKKVSYEK